ncbi:metallophosphoesterase [Steroidobacter sp. S1-65]|uniref:Metallophosphoesterase n=1 Tax=Steroidobacter gossypii TaxID=2805490 RepID=A0ABS1X246_9GAMM|nr:metallophosphoesterase [Steroidobacter gossypii]MBM0107279.1 metallophosphoesterase [Steroidobacter gossypii]
MLAVLGLLHVYIGLRLLPDLSIGITGQAIGALLLVASWALIPSVLRRSRRGGADALLWTALIAMGLFSSLFVFTLLRDLSLLIAALIVPTELTNKVQNVTAWIVVGAAVFATAIGYLNARRVARVVHVDVPIPDLPAALHGFSIAQISDIHVGPTIRRNYVEGIVAAVNGLEADAIAITGDLVDGSVRELASHVAPLAQLRAKYGTFFVTGNHEYYSGERAWTNELRRLGMRVLMNEHVVVDHGDARLVIAGVTDYSAHHFDPVNRSDPAVALADAPTDAGAKILLAHQPRSAPAAAAAGFDLQLSGHTHGGQFWPWNFFVRFQQPFTAGLDRLGSLWIYTSRGTGYWGPPKRFGAPSEITRIRLVCA